MTISNLIAELQVILAQYGDLQVWMEHGGPTSPRPVVQEMFTQGLRQPPEKVVMIE